MSRHTRRSALVLAGGAVLVTVVGTSFSSSAETATPAVASAPTSSGQVAFVQAVPAQTLWVSLDGAIVKEAVKGGEVVGPLPLAPGAHTVAFGDGPTTMTSSSFEVTAGTDTDLVLHRPAEVGGTPVVTTYALPLEALGPDKARVLLAHTATTAPADVRVDGTTVFTNIANGEYAQADVAAGTHEVALYPSGVMTQPILGPIPVDLKAGTVTAVYAVGNPTQGSMNVVVRRAGVSTTTTSAPRQIDTGSAGLAGSIAVTPFSVHR